MLRLKRQERGFTLIELMIAVTIAIILLLLTIPTFSTWSNNQKIRSAAEGVFNGLQTARMEALKRNQSIEFVLTADNPTSAGVTESSSGKNWVVRQGTTELIQGWSGAISSGTTPDYGSSVSKVTFNSLGRNTSNSTITFDFTISAAGTCKANSGDVRCLRVNVGSGGEVRMCDPSVTTTGDTRKC